MNILSLPLGADTGGVSAALGRAFSGVEGWSFRSIITTPNYIGYPIDLTWSPETVRQWWTWADVIHLHHNLRHLHRLRHLPKRPIVLQFHGTGFREGPRPFLADMRRCHALGLVATLDLWLLSPRELEWLPCPVQIEPRIRDSDVLRIAHAPTNRAIKSTQAFLDATAQLRAEFPIEVDLIEGVSWKECLARKREADIYFDQVLLGYGNNAIECWGMGIPVIAGAQPATQAEMVRRFGELPFYNATEDTIYDALRAMIRSPMLRAEYAERGMEHVRKFHDERVVVEQLKDVYRRAAA